MFEEKVLKSLLAPPFYVAKGTCYKLLNEFPISGYLLYCFLIRHDYEW